MQRSARFSGQIAMLIGPLPTVMGADTAAVAVVITDTVPSADVVGECTDVAVTSVRLIATPIGRCRR